MNEPNRMNCEVVLSFPHLCQDCADVDGWNDLPTQYFARTSLRIHNTRCIHRTVHTLHDYITRIRGECDRSWHIECVQNFCTYKCLQLNSSSTHKSTPKFERRSADKKRGV